MKRSSFLKLLGLGAAAAAVAPVVAHEKPKPIASGGLDDLHGPPAGYYEHHRLWVEDIDAVVSHANNGDWHITAPTRTRTHAHFRDSNTGEFWEFKNNEWVRVPR